jgi:hypothetical protein
LLGALLMQSMNKANMTKRATKFRQVYWDSGWLMMV